MTNPTTPNVPAAWYPDPAGSGRQRWWDGTQWTEHFQDSYTAAAAGGELKAPAGTKSYNVWIWLVTVLPFVTVPFLPLIDVGSAFTRENLQNPEAMDRAQFELLFSPAYISLMLVGLLSTVLIIFFAYKDWSELKKAGVPQPFHWAFVFLNLVIGPVYAIGRSVIVKRRTGHGSAVMWVTIALIVLSIVVVVVWTVALISQIVEVATL
ncbi:hypothetical protein M2152_001462 [Microbacteriaceae bacterium SG_E_30_P1]|uniref:DUF2510 domain-containing protein n=1 Tax=Antiquaquibacter oligotrophicus TaxID=2880260 RepID=A0ABT6KMP4_9MICO|nr:DUF2510 domain-containing protein [Antiquaquibacter oligotrophicus]MDH6181280.1 hypothetical protein [Antiquaquibacter oligotrophicus]UDF13027.1 DUF2510 domain-containing protein [Antiquaquibacter oligotrophicus]